MITVRSQRVMHRQGVNIIRHDDTIEQRFASRTEFMRWLSSDTNVRGIVILSVYEMQPDEELEMLSLNRNFPEST